MSLKIRIVMLIFAVVLFLTIINLLRKKKIPVMYSIIWFFVSLIILLVSIVPNFLTLVASFIGFEAMSSLIIGIMLVLLIFISIVLTIIVSNQKKIIITLIQEVSLLREKSNEK